MNAVIEFPALIDEALVVADDPQVVFEADIDEAAELREFLNWLDAEAEYELEALQEVAECCGGRARDCAHYGIDPAYELQKLAERFPNILPAKEF